MVEQRPKQQGSAIFLSWESFGVGMLLLVLLGALAIPEWVVLVTNAPVPWLDYNLPYIGPWILAIFVFNILTASRLNGGRILIQPESLLFILFVVVSFAIELGHVITIGGDICTRLHLSLFWMVVYYFVLRSFRPLWPNGREWIVFMCIWIVFCLAALNVLGVVFFSSGRGNWFLGINPDQFFDSIFVAYLAVFAFALVLFEHKPRNHVGVLIQYALVSPVLALAIYLQRLVGPVLLFLALIVLKGFALIQSKKTRILILIGIVALLLVGILYMLSNADDPTLKGLGGGTYFFDEIGIVHGDIISSYIRRESILQELRLFLDSPVFGVGMRLASEEKVLMFGLHSSLIYILVASGLLGFCLFFLPIVWATFRALLSGRGLSILALPMTMMGCMILAPRVMWWWSIAMYLVSSKPNVRQRLTESTL